MGTDQPIYALAFHDYHVQPTQTADPFTHLALPDYAPVVGSPASFGGCGWAAAW